LLQLWTPLNVILFNLVCSDFSVSILGNPWTMTASIRMGWDFGQTLCVAYGFFMSLLGERKILFQISFYSSSSSPSHQKHKIASSLIGKIVSSNFLVFYFSF